MLIPLGGVAFWVGRSVVSTLFSGIVVFMKLCPAVEWIFLDVVNKFRGVRINSR